MNATINALTPRHGVDQILRSLQQARVVLLNGPRQAGKTTLVRDLVRPRVGGTFATLDDGTELAACRADPTTFLDRPRPLIVDEFQRGGDQLLRAVKALVDEDPRPGQFILTGSTRFLTVPTISESLAGRVHIVDLWPYTQGEAQILGERADRFLLSVFGGERPWELLPASGLPTRRDYLELVCHGGYPEAITLDSQARRAFFRNYVRTVTQRDVPEISRIRHVDELPRILRLLAAATATQIKDTDLAEHLRVDRRTLRANYLPLLETVYLCFELPAWSRNLVSRVSKQPKTHLVDTGLAAYLLGMSSDRLAEPTAVATGSLVETFAVNELVRQVSRCADALGVTLYHYRSHGGTEIDVIAESDDGRLVALEIKAAASARSQHFSQLAALRDRIDGLPDMEFVRGIVLYTGTKALRFGERLDAVPLAALWRPSL